MRQGTDRNQIVPAAPHRPFEGFADAVFPIALSLLSSRPAARWIRPVGQSRRQGRPRVDCQGANIHEASPTSEHAKVSKCERQG